MWSKLHLLSATITIAILVTDVQSFIIPCDSPLRLFRPEYFKHCDCVYKWTDWEVVEDSVVDVPEAQCETKQAYSEMRKEVSFVSNCSSQTETRQICESYIYS